MPLFTSVPTEPDPGRPRLARRPRQPRLARRLGLGDAVVLGLGSMVGHRASASVQVDPRGGAVHLDGERLAMDPVQSVPLSRLYFL